MFVRTLLAASVAAALLVPHANAASADYYVDYSIAGPASYASTTVHVDAPNGQALVRPADACGIRFEYPDDADWLVDIFDDVDTRTDGHIDVWLPDADCGAWNNIVIEPDNLGADDVTFAPYGVPGTLRVLDAYAYWLDSSGHKLVYKHCCGIDYVYGKELRASFVNAEADIDAVKRLLPDASTSPTLGKRLAESERSLMALGRNARLAMDARRAKPAGALEPAVRRLEDDAQRHIDEATRAHQTCRAYAPLGTAAALPACDAALDGVEHAEAALATVDTWFVDTSRR